LIVLSPLQDVGFVGVDVEMHVVAGRSIPRTSYLRRVTLATFQEYQEDLYGDKEEEPILKREIVDTTFVSDVSEPFL